MSKNVVKVFNCDDLRKYILSFIINKRCKCCHNVMCKHESKLKYYYEPKWCKAENRLLKNYCNWCYYYVFEK